MGLDKYYPFAYSIGDFCPTSMATEPNIYNGLFAEIKSSLQDLGGWGSVEIFVQDGKVTQITKRAIRKTEHTIDQLNSQLQELI